MEQMVRILHIENVYGETIRIPLYPRFLSTLLKKAEGEPFYKGPPEIHLSVDDICTAVRILIEEGAMTDCFDSSPNVQRLHKFFKASN